MSGSRPKITLIGEEDAPPPPPTEQAAVSSVNATLLLLSLRALSQRTVMELARLGSIAFTGALVFSVWLLAARVLPEPSPHQLIALAGYAVFCLLADIVRRRS